MSAQTNEYAGNYSVWLPYITKYLRNIPAPLTHVPAIDRSSPRCNGSGDETPILGRMDSTNQACGFGLWSRRGERTDRYGTEHGQ
ncbi:unnamed protein product [Calicophoron daubneyi]|uniref:Uncharacterized protein n=1 Tax=Calicophoron daubneyi TaxID=300641 RepID=A0AAV2TX25_CALDB